MTHEVRGGEAGHSPLSQRLRIKSLIRILTGAAAPEGMAQGPRETRGQWILQRWHKEGSCKSKDDSSRLWWQAEGKTSPWELPSSLCILKTHRQKLCLLASVMGKQPLKNVLEILYKLHAGKAEGTEVARADKRVPSEPPCFQNVPAENRDSTDPVLLVTCLLECQTCSKVWSTVGGWNVGRFHFASTICSLKCDLGV